MKSFRSPDAALAYSTDACEITAAKRSSPLSRFDGGETIKILRPLIAGVVLAGGRSTRMGAEKALLKLAGRSLIAHAVDRLRPQVAELFVSANGDPARFGDLGCAVVADGFGGGASGPLAGIAAALGHARSQGAARLAVAPCDAPFLSCDLVARLAAAMDGSGAPLAVAESARGLEPLFALWRVDLEAAVAAALAAGEGGPRGLIERLSAARVVFPPEAGVDAFANLNTPEELAAAQARLG